MTLSEREKRLMMIWPIALVGILVFWWATKDSSVPQTVAPVDNIPTAEQRLRRLRELAAIVPAKQQVLDQASKELDDRERGLIKADTAAQAQEQLLQVLRKLASRPTTALNLRNTEIGPVKPYGDRYGEVTVSLNFDARIEQLVNLVSDLMAQKELIGVSDLRVGTAAPKEKIMPVRITISALVRRELVPEKRAGSL
jgi:hypothetical protein